MENEMQKSEASEVTHAGVAFLRKAQSVMSLYRIRYSAIGFYKEKSAILNDGETIANREHIFRILKVQGYSNAKCNSANKEELVLRWTSDLWIWEDRVSVIDFEKYVKAKIAARDNVQIADFTQATLPKNTARMELRLVRTSMNIGLAALGAPGGEALQRTTPQTMSVGDVFQIGFSKPFTPPCIPANGGHKVLAFFRYPDTEIWMCLNQLKQWSPGTKAIPLKPTIGSLSEYLLPELAPTTQDKSRIVEIVVLVYGEAYGETELDIAVGDLGIGSFEGDEVAQKLLDAKLKSVVDKFLALSREYRAAGSIMIQVS
jgi:hypothetical protein